MNAKWDKRMMDLAKHFASWSKDPSTKVGCVIARNKYIVSVGYNGFRPSEPDDLCLYADRKYKYEHVVHAEQNAIESASVSVEGMTAYTWPLAPCFDCAVLLQEAGIKRIVSPEPSAEHRERWGESLQAAQDYLEKEGVELVLINK